MKIERKEMMMGRSMLAKYSMVALGILVVVAIAILTWVGQRADRYREMFSGVQLGMSKNDVAKVVGVPTLIDTSGSEYEVWTYNVPSLFAERPRCFYRLGDSILVRFVWEPVDTSLAVDEPVDSGSN